MIRLEQITALALAAALAIPSYWFFWTLAGGGGYERREMKKEPLIKERTIKQISNETKAPHEP
mgnify:CR=1 FL=1